MENGGYNENRRKLPLEVEVIEGTHLEQEPQDIERKPMHLAVDTDLEQLEAEQARLDEEEIKKARQVLDSPETWKH